MAEEVVQEAPQQPRAGAATEEAPNAVEVKFESPPAVEIPVRNERDEARVRLVQLADTLRRTQSRRLLVEFLQLRRAMR